MNEKRKTIPVIQINLKGRKYFCKTEVEKQMFLENNPNRNVEIDYEIEKEKKKESYRDTKHPNHVKQVEKIAGLVKQKMETFEVELPEQTAREYLNDPENKEQFKRKEQVNG